MLLMDVLLSKCMSNIYYWEKLTFPVLQSSWKETLKKCTSFEDQKGTSYIWGNVHFGIVFSCLSSTKQCLRFLSNYLVWEIKDFLGNVPSEFLRKWCWFQGHNECFVDERAMKTMTLICSCHWKTLIPLWKTLLLAKEKAWKHIFNTNSELLKNCTKNKLSHSKNSKLAI